MKDKMAQEVLLRCLGAKKGETLLVVTDESREEIGRLFYEAGRALGLESLLLMMAPRAVSGEEPPAAVAHAMQAADIILAPTAVSLTHTNARIAAVKAGARVATMPGITMDMLEAGAMTADYDEVLALTTRVTERLTRASTARIEKDGYVLTLSLKGRPGVPSPGVYRNPGEAGNLPSGEAYIAPCEDASQGEVSIDGAMVGIGMLQSPLHMVIRDGKLISVTGADSEKLAVLLETPENATLCELGIGTNKAARLTGVILEDEKVYGTVHIAFGTNTSFGGVNKAACHMDGIILAPTLYLDDVKVLDAGKFIFFD